MKILLRYPLLLIILAATSVLAWQSAAAQTPAIGSQVTFLYYKDLEPAAAFYGDILGLQQAFDGDWVKIYRLTESSLIGLVDEAKGFLKTAPDKPVMFSVETPDVAAWYAYVKAKAPASIKTPLKAPGDGFANSFMVLDPAGYHIEFFQWNAGYGYDR